MPSLRVNIVRFVDAHQPGWVACEFRDADGRVHTLTDKGPVFAAEHLDAASIYPRPGVAGCEVLARWVDAHGRELARITTHRPWGIESADGQSEFVVLASEVSPDPARTTST